MASKFHGGNNLKEKLFIRRLCEKLVPDVYASIILAMYDGLRLEPDEIEAVVLRSQQIWHDSTEGGWDMKENCLECTGIDVRYFKSSGNIV